MSRQVFDSVANKTARDLRGWNEVYFDDMSKCLGSATGLRDSAGLSETKNSMHAI